MSQSIKKKIEVKTDSGNGIIDSIHISELGYLMIRVSYGDKWISYNITNIKKLLENSDLKLIETEEYCDI